MATKLTLGGFRELQAALRKLPAHLRDEGRRIAQGHVDTAEATIRAAYVGMTKSGNLERGLRQQHQTAGGQAGSRNFGVVIVLKTAPHAYIVESGTKLPRTTTRGGWNRGQMPAAHVFLPPVIRARRAMVDDLIALVRGEGLEVSSG